MNRILTLRGGGRDHSRIHRASRGPTGSARRTTSTSSSCTRHITTRSIPATPRRWAGDLHGGRHVQQVRRTRPAGRLHPAVEGEDERRQPPALEHEPAHRAEQGRCERVGVPDAGRRHHEAAVDRRHRHVQRHAGQDGERLALQDPSDEDGYAAGCAGRAASRSGFNPTRSRAEARPQERSVERLGC